MLLLVAQSCIIKHRFSYILSVPPPPSNVVLRKYLDRTINNGALSLHKKYEGSKKVLALMVGSHDHLSNANVLAPL